MDDKELWDAFEAHLVGQNYAINTIIAYRGDVDRFLDFLAGRGLGPADATAAHVTDWLAHLADSGISAASRGRKLNAVRGFFRFLIDTARAGKNPAAGVKTPKADQKARRVLSEIEYRRLRDIVRDRSARDYAIVELTLQTGLRASEVCNLRYPTDIAFSNKSVHASVTVREAKSRRDRLVPLNSTAERAIKAYLDVRPTDGGTDHLFLANRKTPLTRPLLHRMLTRYFRLARISGASFHTLRHTFATHSLDKGTNLLVVKETLGHKHLTTTQKYLHFIRERQVEELEKNAL